jgi:hypothetical protein
MKWEFPMENLSSKVNQSSLVSVLVAITTISLLCALAMEVNAKGKPAKPPKGDTEYSSFIELQDIDSHLTFPSGQFRWLDIANHAYGDAYRNGYDYTQAAVIVAYTPSGASLKGQLTANNLKPNFAYQVKLSGDPIKYTQANENIGLVGRWWREEWDESANTWSQGHNSSDTDYFDNAGENFDSPTGLKYKFTGYLVFEYFITNSKGNALLEFEVNSSYHVLYKTTQLLPQSDDGEVKTATYKVNAKGSAAYDVNYSWVKVGVYGEVERIPVGGKFPAPGAYNCQLFLTEESFHGDGDSYVGNWAAAMGASISFEISE